MLGWLLTVWLLLHVTTGTLGLLNSSTDFVLVGRNSFREQLCAGLSAFTEPFVTIEPGWGQGFDSLYVVVSRDLRYREALIAATAMHAAYIVLILLLPSPFLRAKVAWPHVMRMAVYGLGFLFAAATVRLVTNGAACIRTLIDVFARGRTPDTTPSRYPEEVMSWLGLLSIAWVMWWWYTTISTGWRVERARYVLFVLSVPAGLVAIIGLTVGFARSGFGW